MKIEYGKGQTKYGPGVEITLTGDELATAIDAYLVAHGIIVRCPSTISIDGEICRDCNSFIYVDPSGFVVTNGTKYSGSGDL